MSSIPPGQVPLNKSSMKRSATHPDDACTYRSVSILKEAPVLSEIRPVVQKNAPVSMPSAKRVKTWHVTDDAPQLLPSYPLEKTKVTIDKNSATPSIIATRISEALRRMSIEATFDSKRATASLVTECQVEMNITLFKDDENEGTIVEVQRMQGCGAAFHRYTRCILSAAQGLSTGGEEEELNLTVPRTLKRENIFCEQKDLKNVLLALELVDSLLRLDQFDANRLGMESLCALTQPDKSSAKAARLVAQVVLSGNVDSLYSDLLLVDEDSGPIRDTAGCVGPNIRDTIMDLILKNPSDERNDDDVSLQAHVKDKNSLRRLALAVFANSLSLVTGNDCFEPNLKFALHDSLELVSALLEMLKNADGRPCDACLAAKCLGLLFRVSNDARRCSLSVEAVPIIRMALDVGCERHAKLQSAAEGLLRLVE